MLAFGSADLADPPLLTLIVEDDRLAKSFNEDDRLAVDVDGASDNLNDLGAGTFSYKLEFNL